MAIRTRSCSASSAALAEHERVLMAIDRETRGGCLWLAAAGQAN